MSGVGLRAERKRDREREREAGGDSTGRRRWRLDVGVAAARHREQASGRRCQGGRVRASPVAALYQGGVSRAAARPAARMAKTGPPSSCVLAAGTGGSRIPRARCALPPIGRIPDSFLACWPPVGSWFITVSLKWSMVWCLLFLTYSQMNLCTSAFVGPVRLASSSCLGLSSSAIPSSSSSASSSSSLFSSSP